MITIETNDLDAEELALNAIDAGAEDVKVENNYVEIYTKPEELEMIRTALDQKNLPAASAELSMLPKTMVELEEKAALQTLKLLDKLEGLDDVQHVFSNIDFSDSTLEKYKAQV
ncbi:putative transcriptional regulatory protein [subsurface metagenome]